MQACVIPVNFEFLYVHFMPQSVLARVHVSRMKRELENLCSFPNNNQLEEADVRSVFNRCIKGCDDILKKEKGRSEHESEC